MEAKAGMFHAFGIDPASLFADRDESYLDFSRERPERSELLERFLELLLPHAPLDEYERCGAFAEWWAEYAEILRDHDYITGSVHAVGRLDGLGHALRIRLTKVVSARRGQLVDSFPEVADRYTVSFSELQQRSEDASAAMNDRLAQLGFRRSVD
ncbi:hypothetical protein [Streptomonospora salina]|uniref:Uncharacterized protein n=1 Tax=Streptomonospora salina TaxID=104205 RepID=A0A841E8E2_9ACTN|nr:hypothetical protein [Streptomonospora salina]